MSGRAAAAALCLAAAAALPARAAEPASAWLGTWVRAERARAADEAALRAEIERVTEPMSRWFRGLARAAMRRHIRPSERYEIARVGAVLVIRSDGDALWRVDGQPQGEAGGDGATSRLDARGAIVQDWRHGGSHGRTVWRLDPADGTALVAVVAHERRLSEPLRYTTRYRRLDP